MDNVNDINEKFFVQMSGFPGSGKSTLARAISERTGAVIIDQDVVKSALLNSVAGAQMDPKLVGKLAYDVDWSLLEFHLSLGQSVILDSPCLYEELVEKGRSLSQKYNATYKYVECYLDDMNEVNSRLANRKRMTSQIKEVQSEENFFYTIQNSKKPAGCNCLVVDTGQPFATYIQDVFDYIHE